MTTAREHRRAVRRIQAKKVGRDQLRTWEKKRLEVDGQSIGAGGKK